MQRDHCYVRQFCRFVKMSGYAVMSWKPGCGKYSLLRVTMIHHGMVTDHDAS
jgi:hypothetical protein